MEVGQGLALDEVLPDRKAGIVGTMLTLWIWLTLWMSYGPSFVQEQFHYIPQIALMTLAVPLVLRRVYEGQPLSVPREAVVYLVWMVWLLSGLFVAVRRDFFWSCLFRQAKVGALFVLMTWGVDSGRRLKALILGGFVTGLVLVVSLPMLGIMNYELELSEMVFGGRETGALGNPNSLADMSVLCFIGLMMAMATARTPWTKVLPVLFLPIPIYASFRTGSRNALVGLFIAVVLTYFFYLRPTLRGRPILRALGLTVVLACVGVGAYAALTYAPFAWRYKGMWEFLTTGQSAEFMEESRVVMFLAELRMTMSHPFLGVGLGQDLFRLIEYMPTLHQMFIHSDFAGLGGLIGLPGWALFYVILISLTVRGHRLSKHPLVSPQEAGLLIFCVIFMVSSITRTFYGSMYAAIYSWVLWGGIAGYILSVHARVRAMESAGRLAPEGLSTSETAPELGGVVRPGF